MWENTIGSNIRRANRNLLVCNLLLLIVVCWCLSVGCRTAFNELAGPVPMDNGALLKTSDPSKLFRYNVTIASDHISQPIYQTTLTYYNRRTGEKGETEV